MTTKTRIVGIAAVALIAGGLAAGCGPATSTKTAAPPPSTSQPAAPPATTTPPAPPATKAPPATTAPAPAATTPEAPALTASQQQAVTAAQGYLDLGSGFSRYSLIQQLTSQYGSGFSRADAEFAVKYLHPDWNAQAVLAAQGYMKLGTGFSRSGLIQQLTSTFGNGFTEAQAEYAASQVGL